MWAWICSLIITRLQHWSVCYHSPPSLDNTNSFFLFKIQPRSLLYGVLNLIYIWCFSKGSYSEWSWLDFIHLVRYWSWGVLLLSVLLLYWITLILDDGINTCDCFPLFLYATFLKCNLVPLSRCQDQILAFYKTSSRKLFSLQSDVTPVQMIRRTTTQKNRSQQNINKQFYLASVFRFHSVYLYGIYNTSNLVSF